MRTCRPTLVEPPLHSLIRIKPIQIRREIREFIGREAPNIEIHRRNARERCLNLRIGFISRLSLNRSVMAPGTGGRKERQALVFVPYLSIWNSKARGVSAWVVAPLRLRGRSGRRHDWSACGSNGRSRCRSRRRPRRTRAGFRTLPLLQLHNLLFYLSPRGVGRSEQLISF